MLFGVFGLQRGPKWMPKWLRKPWKSCPGSRHGEETRKRAILATFLYDFVSIFHIFLCCVFYSFWWHWQRSRKAAISNPDRKTHGSASKITFSQMWSRQKKSHKMVKKHIKNGLGNKTQKNVHLGSIFLPFWTQKPSKMRSRGHPKTCLEMDLKKEAKKWELCHFMVTFGGGLGEPGTLIFPPFFSHRQLWGPKWLPGLPRDPPGAIRASFFYVFASFFYVFF